MVDKRPQNPKIGNRPGQSKERRVDDPVESTAGDEISTDPERLDGFDDSTPATSALSRLGSTAGKVETIQQANKSTQDSSLAVKAGATAAGATAAAGTLATVGSVCVGGACYVGAGAAATTAATTGVGAGLAVTGAQITAAAVSLSLSIALLFGGGADLEDMVSLSTPLRDAFESTKPVVLEFYADDCPNCINGAHRLKSIEKARAGDVSWVMVDTKDARNQQLWELFGVDEIPHFAFLDRSKTLSATEIGLISTQKAEDAIEKIITSPATPRTAQAYLSARQTS